MGIGENGAKSENSVGKSTLLMIIDFCFGGNQFLHSKAVEIIGPHTICFAFAFNKITYHFMRTTDRGNRLFKCDENYQNPQNYTIEEFRTWLKEQYRLENIELSFRQIVSTYFRFYGDKNISPREILRTHDTQSATEQIRVLEKLFEKYPYIKDSIEHIQSAENLKKIKTQANRLNVTIAEFKEIDRAETEEKIADLETKKKELQKDQQAHIIELDAQKAKDIAALKVRQQKLSAKRSRLLTRIENLEHADFKTAKPSKATYDALLEFFPNADIKKLEEIDSFHEKLSDILAEEYEEALEEYKSELDDVQTEIKSLESQIADFGNGEDFTTAFLLEFAKIQSRIDHLKTLLKDDEHKKAVLAQASTDKKTLQAKEKEILGEIEHTINAHLTSLCEAILGEDIEAIRLSFPTNATYSLGSPLDDGTGTDYISLILFDLSVLYLTKLPALIHDSYLISNIRGNRLENLIKTYAKITDKQVFLSIDETEKLHADTAELVNRDGIKVIKLRKNSGELYGSCWSKKE